LFSTWRRWQDRERLDGKSYPGVYILAISNVSLHIQPFLWRRDIVYVGMTNAATGLAGRLKQFDLTIRANGWRTAGRTACDSSIGATRASSSTCMLQWTQRVQPFALVPLVVATVRRGVQRTG